MINNFTFLDFAKFSSPMILYLILMIIVKISLDKIPIFRQQSLQSAVGIIKSILHMLILCICLIVTMGTLGIDIQGIIQGIGLLSLSIGLIFKDLGSNIITSLSFLFYKPFSINDIVRIDGIEGKVVKFDMKYTILDTEGELHLIPNSSISNTKITIIKKNSNSNIDQKNLSISL